MLNKNRFTMFLGAALITLTMSACNAAQQYGGGAQNSGAVASSVVTDAAALSQGSFSGRSDHITTGQVSLEQTTTGYQLRFAPNFSLDGAPDPIVAIGNNETYLAANKIGTLQNKSGAQIYQLPAGFTPGQFSQVYIWCEQFSVPLGVANLT